jgi:hypothetical protein
MRSERKTSKGSEEKRERETEAGKGEKDELEREAKCGNESRFGGTDSLQVFTYVPGIAFKNSSP